MAEYVYPARDIDRPDLLLSYLGSHWASVYRGQRQIRAIAKNRGRAANQTAINLQEAVDAVSRFTVPIYHTDHWYRLVLAESDLNSAQVATPKYGASFVYGTDPFTGVQIKYGTPQNLYSAFPLPSGIKDTGFIFNRLTSPSLSLVKNLDYLLADGVITFRENPFNNPLISTREVYKDGAVVDREIVLWLFRAQIDGQDIYNQHGYVINLQLDSSSLYRDLVNGIRDAVSEGAASRQLEDAIAAITDTPIVRNASEVVEYILKDERHLLVITDLEVYKYPHNAMAIVSVGDTVTAGNQLVDTVEFIEFHDGTVPSDLVSLVMGHGFLPGGYLGGISWPNKTVSLVVDTSGIFTRVEWELGGFPGDLEKFWDDFHANGVLNPPTLAQLLDVRANPVGEPGAASLPATVNPLEFLVQNVLRNHAFIVRIKHTRLGKNALSLANFRHLRRIIPPHTHMIVVVELAVDDETITMEAPGTETAPGFEEAPVLGPGLEPIDETIDGSTLITGTPTLKYTEGYCV